MKQSSLWSDRPDSPGYVESWARKAGLLPVLGLDEAGRGCLAGPVVVAAVVLPDPPDVPGIHDSKLLTPSGREEVEAHVRARALAFAVVEKSHARIDDVNILQATLEAMREAAEAAMAALAAAGRGPVGVVIVDGNQPVPGLAATQRAWPKGDRLSLNCAAASILAKVHRDRLMDGMDGAYPGYGFAIHKGYATAEHRDALARLGPCAIHRRSFAPCRPTAAEPAPAGGGGELL
jgi:ribonuclease HII